nr:helix-turn-helix transcriptional regulator [uncultured Fusobacterium sp.]
MNIEKIFEQSFNYKKLKEVRLKNNLSLKEAAEKLSLTSATLSRYETGKIKEVPIEVLKKMGELYKFDYRYFFGWQSITFFSSLFGMILASIYIFSPASLFNGTLIGALSGMAGFDYLAKYYEKTKIKELNMKKNFYNQLTEDEKEEYEAFKNMNYAFLKTKKLFTKNEIEEAEGILLSYYFAHKARRENKMININNMETEEEVKKNE